MPRFSVVVPTRDRPDLLAFCLEAVAGQTFDDVEVVVCDNAVERPAREVFGRFAAPSWRYVRPDRPLPMHENFERACEAATGDHVAVVIDKTVLQPTAFEVADRALGAEPADIVTWGNDGYNPVDEAASVGRGRFIPAGTVAEPQLYDPKAELARRFANETRRGADPVHYVRGKIVFGSYSRQLLERIRGAAGRVFHPLAPDYTSLVPAAVLADRALDVGRPLLVSYNSSRSNGRRQGVDPTHARRFIEAVDPAIVGSLPVAGLYASVHNVVAYDLVSSAARCPPGSTPELDRGNLARRAREDLDSMVWTDPAERAAQYAILEAEEKRLGITPTRTAGRGRFAQLWRRAAGWRDPSPPSYPSPVDAARAAERHYAGMAA